MLPLIAAMLTYVSCSENEETVETNQSELPAPPPPPAPPANLSQEDAQMMNELHQELLEMEKEEKSFMEISNAFMTEKDKHIKSKESYYRLRVYGDWIMKNNKTRKIEEGTWNEEDEKRHNYMKAKEYNQTYEDYVAYRKTQDKEDFVSPVGVSFSSIETVPTYPGCDEESNNTIRKQCFSDKIRNFVNNNFDVGLGKKLGLTGENRVYVRFVITDDGSIEDVQARAPHPELQKEAERVVNSLPKMQPGIQDGKPVNVLYSLPIIFKID